MKQISSDELDSFERHGLLFVIVRVVTPLEGHHSILSGKYAVIADGDPVRISAEILQNPLGSIEGRLAVDNPFLMIELLSETLEDMRFFQMTDTAWEDEIPRIEGFFEIGKELSPKQFGHNPDRDEEPFTARHPTISLQRQPSTGNNTVDMGMVHKVLSPGMQHTQETDPCAEMFRIA